MRPVTKVLIPPLVPASTIAAFDVSAPSNAFSVETVGWLTPTGQRLMYISGPPGRTVAFNEYAFAVLGIEQADAGTA